MPSDLAHRPVDAIEQERRLTEDEAQDLERRGQLLSAALERRRQHVRGRLRTLYKLSRGGMTRLLLEAGTPLELEYYRRRDGARRVLGRDLEELLAVRDEMKELGREQVDLQERLSRVDELRGAATRARAVLAAGEGRSLQGLARLRGILPRPVQPGQVVLMFGREAHDRMLEVFQHGVELTAEQGNVVRAVAAGQVRYVGELAGKGTGVIIEHDGGYLTLYGKLEGLMVAEGDKVAGGAALGRAAYQRVYFGLALGDVPLDPLPWFGPRGARANPGHVSTR